MSVADCEYVFHSAVVEDFFDYSDFAFVNRSASSLDFLVVFVERCEDVRSAFGSESDVFKMSGDEFFEFEIGRERVVGYDFELREHFVEFFLDYSVVEEINVDKIIVDSSAGFSACQGHVAHRNLGTALLCEKSLGGGDDFEFCLLIFHRTEILCKITYIFWYGKLL